MTDELPAASKCATQHRSLRLKPSDATKQLIADPYGQIAVWMENFSRLFPRALDNFIEISPTNPTTTCNANCSLRNVGIVPTVARLTSRISPWEGGFSTVLPGPIDWFFRSIRESLEKRQLNPR
ncbi:hypothetical protein CRM22_007195 [Opisthorchis felineus]|uniref:Uncharacterized protein n=1 Tax=Opisthorchis felineus TaxID=147828 RepID=A0A4S2LQA7_OPIFE|nr:hypothetical protein CRM22_007195 [Opisthorchis felineus]